MTLINSPARSVLLKGILSKIDESSSQKRYNKLKLDPPSLVLCEGVSGVPPTNKVNQNNSKEERMVGFQVMG